MPGSSDAVVYAVASVELTNRQGWGWGVRLIISCQEPVLGKLTDLPPSSASSAACFPCDQE